MKELASALSTGKDSILNRKLAEAGRENVEKNFSVNSASRSLEQGFKRNEKKQYIRFE